MDAKVKDTKSMLVVTPLKSLVFNYAEGIKGFNTQDGVRHHYPSQEQKATDFKLTSKIITDKLTQKADDSELTVDVKWNGVALSNSTDTTMVDVAAGTSAGLDFLKMALTTVKSVSARLIHFQYCVCKNKLVLMLNSLI